MLMTMGHPLNEVNLQQNLAPKQEHSHSVFLWGITISLARLPSFIFKLTINSEVTDHAQSSLGCLFTFLTPYVQGNYLVYTKVFIHTDHIHDTDRRLLFMWLLVHTNGGCKASQGPITYICWCRSV